MKRMSKEKYLDFVEDEIEDLMSQEPNHKNCEQLAWMLTIKEQMQGGSGGRGRSQRRSNDWDEDDDDDRYSDRYGGRNGGRSFRR